MKIIIDLPHTCSTSYRNCYCTHLMQYVLAKMIFATKRMQRSPGFDPSKFSLMKKSLLHYGADRIEDPDFSRRNENDVYDVTGSEDWLRLKCSLSA